MFNQKNMTEKQLLIKLTALCARSEHCVSDIRCKMERWEIDSDMQQRVIDYLKAENYIDHERYARCFINDKIRYNHWGRYKVEQALYHKGIEKEVYAPLLNEVEDDSYEEILIPLLQNKNKTIKANSDYERRQKLIRFAMQRGFTYEQATKAVDYKGED